jgi:hypothetical protein
MSFNSLYPLNFVEFVDTMLIYSKYPVPIESL